MKIRQTKRFTISWDWLCWREWMVVKGYSGVCFALGPLGVTVWRRVR